jgi:hypothetical protein
MQPLLNAVLEENDENSFNLRILIHRVDASTLQFFCKMKRSISEKTTAVIVA